MTSITDLTGGWDYGSLPDNIVLGQDVYLERREIFEGCRSRRNPAIVLADRVQAFTWCAFNVEADGVIEVGAGSVLVGVVFMCAERIHVGERVTVSYNVTIADSDFHPMDAEARRLDAVANAPGGDRSRRPRLVSAPVSIGDDVRIGIGAIVLKGVSIGSRAVVDAGAVVTRDVPAGATVAGNPAQIRQP